MYDRQSDHDNWTSANGIKRDEAVGRNKNQTQIANYRWSLYPRVNKRALVTSVR